MKHQVSLSWLSSYCHLEPLLQGAAHDKGHGDADKEDGTQREQSVCQTGLAVSPTGLAVFPTGLDAIEPLAKVRGTIRVGRPQREQSVSPTRLNAIELLSNLIGAARTHPRIIEFEGNYEGDLIRQLLNGSLPSSTLPPLLKFIHKVT